MCSPMREHRLYFLAIVECVFSCLNTDCIVSTDFVSSDRSSYSDGGLLYIDLQAKPLFEISANIYIIFF